MMAKSPKTSLRVLGTFAIGAPFIVAGFTARLGEQPMPEMQSPAPSPSPDRSLAQATAAAWNLQEGQIARVSGTDLTVKVIQVRDLTSEGCLRGPIGCPDQVHLEVTQGANSQQIVLYVAHTQFQREQGVNQANIFGYKMVLLALQGKHLALAIEKNQGDVPGQ